jgi:nicotinate-nucleotide--dimethylbenzimidazole phosphoribosyltransferase
MATWETIAARLASLAKPPQSLGLLEEWAALLCRVQGTLTPQVDPASVVVFCADHGVKKADDAISPFPSSVTQAVFKSLCAGVSGTAVLSRSSGAHLTVVDCGINGDVSSVVAGASHSTTIEVVHAKVSAGTADMRVGPAMTEEEVTAALLIGRERVAAEVAQRGARVVAIGEVGIGNTTSASALLASLTGAAAHECCGRGTGLSEDGLAHKVATVQSACDLHAAAVASAEIAVEREKDGLDQLDGSAAAKAAAKAREALRRVGGLELAAMVGAYHEAHERRVVALVDGFISAVAALAAVAMRPECRASMLFATALAEEPLAGRGGQILEESLEAKPALQMGLRLGEGSGAALALPLLRSAAAVITHMATLQDALAL